MTVPVIPDVPTGGGITLSGTIAGHTNTTRYIEPNTDGSLNVVAEAVSGVTVTLQNAQNGSANGTVLALLGNASVIFTVNMAAFTGTVNFECTEDNTNWDPLQVQQEGTNTIATTVAGSTTTSIHLWEGSTAGLQSVRARTSGVSAGTVTVTAHAVPVADAPRVVNANLVSPALGQAAMASSLPVAIASNQGAIGSVVAQAVAGTALAADQTNSELRVSTYVKTSTAGDTALALGQAAMAASLPVTIASNQGGIGNLSTPYPQGATAITAASGDVAASTAAATLAATGGKTTYITGFTLSSTGATGAATVDVTVTNTITGTLTFVYCSVAGATLANPLFHITFPYPIPASTTNQTIVVSCPTLGSGNLHSAVNAYGFQL